MRLILFGAGASFGSERASPYCPPLGARLFEDLRKHYPAAWGALPDSLRERFVPNFEPGMKELWDSGQYDVPTLLRCMADYFAQFRPLSGNSYYRLLEHLSARGAVRGTYFSSLNYDCLFEYAARDARLTISYDCAEPTDPPRLTTWKIHGSCNFLPEGVSAATSGVSYSASAVSWDGGVRIVDCSQVRPFVLQNAFYPAMAIFMEGKPMHSSPSLIKQFQSWWSNAVLDAETIGIIGVRPNPADAHIWEPLSKSRATLVVVGNSEDYREWAARYRKERPMEVVGRYFTDALQDFADAFSLVRF